jgi:hypothetical protein
MKDAYEEYLEALRGLKVATHEVYEQSKATERAMNDLINNSHLRSTLTLLREDIGFKRMLDMQYAANKNYDRVTQKKFPILTNPQN